MSKKQTLLLQADEVFDSELNGGIFNTLIFSRHSIESKIGLLWEFSFNHRKIWFPKILSLKVPDAADSSQTVDGITFFTNIAATSYTGQ